MGQATMLISFLIALLIVIYTDIKTFSGKLLCVVNVTFALSEGKKKKKIRNLRISIEIVHLYQFHPDGSFT